jgi:hypothetical protein
MSTAAVSTSSLYQELQAYFQQRGSDLGQLGQALQNGNLAAAQQEFNAIQTLGQSGPFANGDAFKISQRQQDFAAIGQALQSGDLAGAQQAFAQLESTFHHQQAQSTQSAPAVVVNLSTPASSTSATTSSSTATSAASTTTPAASSTGPEIVLNLGNVTAGEQITIGVNSGANGGEQVTIGVSGQQNQPPEQITLNLNQNTNQEIVLNLFNTLANTTDTNSSTTQSSGVSTTA